MNFLWESFLGSASIRRTLYIGGLSCVCAPVRCHSMARLNTSNMTMNTITHSDLIWQSLKKKAFLHGDLG